MTEVRDKSDKKMDKNEEIDVKIGRLEERLSCMDEYVKGMDERWRLEERLNGMGKDVKMMDDRLHTIEDRMWIFVAGIVLAFLTIFGQAILEGGV